MKKFFPSRPPKPAALLALLILLGAPAPGAVESPLKCPEFKSLCVQAERSGGIDLNSGTAVLEGNVVGHVKEHEMDFFAEKLMAFRNKKNEWVRLELDGDVRLIQPDSEAQADHSIVEPERIKLFGNARMERAPHSIRGDEIESDKSRDRTIVKGAPGEPLLIRFEGAPVKVSQEPAQGGEAPPPDGAARPLAAPAEVPDLIESRGADAVIDKVENYMRLTGNVVIDRIVMDWHLKGDNILLRFDDNNRFTGFRAEGNVVITQPGRTLNSDLALSKNNNETIQLIGNAKIQQTGQFELSSDRIEVYTDARKGVVHGKERQVPITLSFDVASKEQYQLGRKDLPGLAAVGIPGEIQGKLNPLLDEPFEGRNNFSEAAARLLTEKEMGDYFEIIARAALQEEK